MRIFRSTSSAQRYIQQLKQKKKSIGFIPTMGALHEGHLSLIRKSRRENSITVVSIFVNPEQFGSSEDYRKYPREEKKDKLFLKKADVDIIIYPSAEEMYSSSYFTYVEVNTLDKHLCGKSRPGHFKGVTTVICKLLNIAQPDRIYLGQKDAQQAIITGQMIKDLNFNSSLKICPIVREPSGLALSSRNRRLSQKHLTEAPELYNALRAAKKEITKGERDLNKIIGLIKSEIRKKTSGQIDYVQCVNANTLQSIKTLKGKTLIALAVYFGSTRLIDNVIIKVS